MNENISHCACCVCGTTVYMPTAQVKRLKRTHESFYCPVGHSNYFPGKTAEEKKIEELEQRVGLLEHQIKDAYETVNYYMKEAEYHTCLNSYCRFRDKSKKKVREHMMMCDKGMRLLPADAAPHPDDERFKKHMH